jgi:hypothetical protein
VATATAAPIVAAMTARQIAHADGEPPSAAIGIATAAAP